MSELPEGWVEAEIGDLAVDSKRIAYGVLKPGTVDPTGVPMLRVTDIRTNFVDVSSVLMITKKLDQEFARTRLSGNEVLVSIQGTVGRVAIVPGTLRGANVSRTLAVVPVGPACLPNYLRAVLLAPQGQTAMSDETGGSTRASLNLGDLRKIRLPLPPLNEQKRIVARIDSLTEKSREAREALAEVPELLDKLRQSILAAAFRGDLTQKWREQHPDVEPATALLERAHAERRERWEEGELAKFRAKGKVPADGKWKTRYVEPGPLDTDDLPALPAGWCWAAMEEVANVIDPNPSHRMPKYVPKGVPLISTENFCGYDALDLSVGKKVTNDTLLEQQARYQIRRGDFAFSRIGTIGKARPLPPDLEYCLSHALCVIQPYTTGIDPGFLRRMTEADAVLQQAREGTQSVGVPDLGIAKLRRFHVPVPPREEQRALLKTIEQALSRISALEGEHDRSQAQLRILEAAILAKAFRGELVPQDPKDEPATVLLSRIRAERDARPEKATRLRPKGKASAV